MNARWLVLVVVGACGRLAFDAHPDRDAATSTDASTSNGDAQRDAAIDGTAACLAQPCAGTASAMVCGGRCITICSDQVMQDEAANRCAVWGGTLATIHSQIDNDCVLAQSTATRWIGYMQAMGATTLAGNWSWLDGQVSAYLGWGTNEPQDLDGVEDGAEQCAFMFPDATWVDTACTNVAVVACSR